MSETSWGRRKYRTTNWKAYNAALEEASQVIGAGRWHTIRRVTLPLVLPGVLGAAIFVFAEMLGAFAAALVTRPSRPVLGLPARLGTAAAGLSVGFFGPLELAVALFR